MKKSPAKNLLIFSFSKVLTNAFNSLFFIDNKRAFERLKNFIAS